MAAVWVLAAIGVARGFGGSPAFTEVERFSSQLDCEVNRATFSSTTNGVKFSCTKILKDVVIHQIPSSEVVVGDIIMYHQGLRDVVKVGRDLKSGLVVINYIHKDVGQVLNFSTRQNTILNVIR